eukprot:6485809-Amphidinium_carterae.2
MSAARSPPGLAARIQGVPALAGQFWRGVSRVVARRSLRRAHVNDMACGVIRTLNSMYEPLRSSSEVVSRPTAAQMDCVDHFREWHAECCRRLGAPPSDLTGQGSLREILAKQGYDGEPSTLTSLDLQLLALPEEGFKPVSLESAGGEAGAKIVETLLSKVAPESVANQEGPADRFYGTA